jgi:ribosomal protein S18 acetylase RimI-like enzyme
MHPYDIRILTQSDVKSFQALRSRALLEEPESFGSSHEEFVQLAETELAQRLQADSNKLVLGAFSGGRLIGMVGLFRRLGKKAEHKAVIWGMYVEPEHRRRGVARKLMGTAIAGAKALPNLEQLLLTVVTENAEAILLYQSLGFTIYGTEPGALKLDGRLLDEAMLWLDLHTG